MLGTSAQKRTCNGPQLKLKRAHSFPLFMKDTHLPHPDYSFTDGALKSVPFPWALVMTNTSTYDQHTNNYIELKASEKQLRSIVFVG